MAIFHELVLVVLPILTTSLRGYITWKVQKKETTKDEETKRMEVFAQCLQILMLDRIQRLHDVYMAAGEITHMQFSDFEHTYQIYHALGGNGYADKAYEDILDLEIV